MILGTGNPEVLEIVHEQLGVGMAFFANHARGVELKDEIYRAILCSE